ncbi:precorrin-6y C5,15-methyltransferase (decarboxylating) subunit CbiE [Rhodobacter sp. SGA-6-6]|uniref:precorrin-6y C5,15-methyltransferase (decarboxylating) subunit CbiE n=1 Tax=Rhodobacter sp. SGA-6-6 TaxID=2710882 RepID=UPI0013ED9F90|nr:precorrin-6y C5,15-methyltransferase (decarboxylating) subunit CbiE [Rhodobacter sp. SGA-6-6]NGM45930.1 precorrin-6y C5,15-methyltransferase (decarboxylating) subunit CbiE [Rhodobacter sp. SGA-6-6]
MAEWLSIIGIGEDGVEGLGKSSLAALASAEVVFGAPRHLAMVAHPDRRDWPVPFSIAPVLGLRGRRVAVLASGDPFWHGAGGTLAAALSPGEWRAYPAVSCLSLAAARLGWRLEEVTALGLHAAPMTRLRPHLAPGARTIVTLRDGAAVAELAGWLAAEGFGETRLAVMERLGGPAERLRETQAAGFALDDIDPLVTVALEIAGTGRVIPRASGLPDDLFGHDGQITKRPVRALALSALAPRPGELLWDIGAGSGSVGIEWLLAHPSTRAIGIERDPARAARARANAARLGADRLDLREGAALELLAGLPDPQAVFVGGGADEALLVALWQRLPETCRLAVHAVTLETEALLARWHGAKGGSLLRIELSETAPLGRKRGWKAHYPVVQWSVTR